VSTFPVPPSALPGLAPLLSGDLWQRWSDEGKVFPVAGLRSGIRYVRLKPGTSCRLSVFGNGSRPASEPPLGFLLYLFPDVERAALAFLKVLNRPRFSTPGSYEPFMSEDTATVAVPFPNDSEVPGLRHFYRNFRVTRALMDSMAGYRESEWRVLKSKTRRELLAYKPGRRAVFRMDLRIEHRREARSSRLALHTKVENRESFERSAANLAAIHQAIPRGAGFGVPAPLARIEARATTASEWIEGESLETAVFGSRSIPALQATGRALAGLHRLELPLHPARDLLQGPALRDLGRDLALLLPESKNRILILSERIARRIGAIERASSVMLHGDFHLGQVILSGDGPVVVDLDRAGRGHPLSDVGTLLAHLEEAGLGIDEANAFLHGYSEVESGSSFAVAEVRIAKAAALFRRSIFPFRRLEPDWPTQVETRLGGVEALLGGE
jgi:aminoglycoside phosphotransferase (APT) family kinase protein